MINLEKEIREQASVLASLKDKNAEALKNLAKELKENNINNIYFAARGTSDHACVYAQYLFGIEYPLTLLYVLSQQISLHQGQKRIRG